MEELEIITLDDGRDYIITDEFLIDGVKYVYLTLEGDIGTFCIRKINIINNEERRTLYINAVKEARHQGDYANLINIMFHKIG